MSKDSTSKLATVSNLFGEKVKNGTTAPTPFNPSGEKGKRSKPKGNEGEASPKKE